MAGEAQIGMAPVSDEEEGNLPMIPTPNAGKRKPKKVRTPGMGKMLGAANPLGMPSAGSITAGQTPYKSGGKVSASKRADGIAVRGKTKGKVV